VGAKAGVGLAATGGSSVGPNPGTLGVNVAGITLSGTGRSQAVKPSRTIDSVTSNKSVVRFTCDLLKLLVIAAIPPDGHMYT